MKVMLLGASGLTGGLVLQQMLESASVSAVVAPTRRPLGLEHAKLTNVMVDFHNLKTQESLFQVDALVCCLGTTLKKAGSRTAFRIVDYDYVMDAARIARQQGVQAFLLMSAMGASRSSPVFYSRVKGELEEALQTLGFAHLIIYQPSLLMNDRREQRHLERLGVSLMKGVNPLMVGPLRDYRGIDAGLVATAMVKQLRLLAGSEASGQPETQRLRYDEIRALARAG